MGGFRIGQNDAHVTRMWKSEMLNFLCWVDDEECVLEAGIVYGDSEYKLTKWVHVGTINNARVELR